VMTSILLTLLLCRASAADPRQDVGQLERRLQAPVREYDLSEASFVEALIRVANDFHLPMGIEWAREPTSLKNVNLSLRKTTVQQIVEYLVKNQSGYDFSLEKGVIVHVFPRGLVQDRKNFLNLRVEKFEVRNDFVRFADRRLRELASRVVSPRGRTPGAGEGGSMATGMGDRRVTFELHNATYRDVLDALSLAGDFNLWMVTFSADGSVTPTGFRRTVSPRAGTIVPDSEQPFWELLMWGQKPY